MTKHSPHLPPPACNVGTHYKLQSLWKVLFVVFIAFLSGMTAAFVAIAWIVPARDTGPFLRTLDRGIQHMPNSVPDPLFAQQTRQRLLSLYDKRKKVGSYYPEDAWLGHAIQLSSDGWVAVYDPDNALPDGAWWEAFDYQGIPHKLQRIVRNPQTRVSYAQFEGQGFRIMSFANWDAVETGMAVWALLGKEWRQGYIDGVRREEGMTSFPIWQAQYHSHLLPLLPKKSILLTDQGAFVGFVGENNAATQGWLMDDELGSLLDSGRIAYRAVPWKGFFVSRVLVAEGAQERNGFYVQNGGATAPTSVQTGDVVVSVNGHSVDPFTIAREVLTAPDEFDADILRNGSEMKVRVKKSEVGY